MDFVATVGEQLVFYDNGVKLQSETLPSRDLTALTYDALHETLIFVDKQSDNGSIFSYNQLTKQYHSLVAKKTYENIQDVAVDPIKKLLFWTDTYERSIYWISLEHGYENYVYGNLLFKMDYEIPRSIAVDSCSGYVYWTNTNVTKPTIERSRYNSFEREVLIDDDIYMPVSLTIDQRTKKMFWADDKEGIHYTIETADLDGKNRITLISGFYHQPNALTVSKDFVYWVDWSYKSIWKISKSLSIDSEPIIVTDFNETPFGIAAYYKMEDQIEGNEECVALRALLPSYSKTSVFDSIAKNDKTQKQQKAANYPSGTINPFHSSMRDETTTSINDLILMNSEGNYLTDEERKIVLCHNFCLNGDCNVNSDGKPECQCDKLYLGKRCETNVCYNYCLNNGVCIYGDKGLPGCSCPSNYEGFRCEILKRPINVSVSLISGCLYLNSTGFRFSNLVGCVKIFTLQRPMET
ncbi:hypothetical protein HW555_004043 [Spodoptera exigua]|uniref:Protein cueball n=1 Tax=Spodoptera exigua TaxID=7107 RepID=A0A835GMQ8_SPOEX|nr:hypothetical protein HW555_004043 [Spodoptera exigua]